MTLTTISRPFHQLVSGISARREQRRARRDLARLDDHLLCDIGVSRGDVQQLRVDGR